MIGAQYLDFETVEIIGIPSPFIVGDYGSTSIPETRETLKWTRCLGDVKIKIFTKRYLYYPPSNMPQHNDVLILRLFILRSCSSAFNILLYIGSME